MFGSLKLFHSEPGFAQFAVDTTTPKPPLPARMMLSLTASMHAQRLKLPQFHHLFTTPHDRLTRNGQAKCKVHNCTECHSQN
jgi:hypothetical protein